MWPFIDICLTKTSHCVKKYPDATNILQRDCFILDHTSQFHHSFNFSPTIERFLSDAAPYIVSSYEQRIPHHCPVLNYKVVHHGLVMSLLPAVLVHCCTRGDWQVRGPRQKEPSDRSEIPTSTISIFWDTITANSKPPPAPVPPSRIFESWYWAVLMKNGQRWSTSSHPLSRFEELVTEKYSWWHGRNIGGPSPFLQYG